MTRKRVYDFVSKDGLLQNGLQITSMVAGNQERASSLRSAAASWIVYLLDYIQTYLVGSQLCNYCPATSVVINLDAGDSYEYLQDM